MTDELETTALEQSSEIETPQAPVEEEEKVETTVAEPKAEAEEPESTEAPESTESPETPDIPEESEAEESVEAEQAIVQQTFATKEAVVARVQEIAASDELGDKTELALLKQLFYKFHNAEVQEAFKAFIEAGGEEDKFMPEIDPAEPLFREAMQTIRERRAAVLAEAGHDLPVRIIQSHRPRQVRAGNIVYADRHIHRSGYRHLIR